MPNLTDSDLRDPSPPVPGAKERAAVAARAHQLGRRHRVVQGAGALGMVAAVAVGVAALTAGGTSSSPGGRRITAAGSATDTPSGLAATTTTAAPAVTTVTTVAPAPAPTPPVGGDTSGQVAAPTPVTEAAPPVVAAPSVFTVSGTVSNVPAGVTLTLTLSGSNGTFGAVADGVGHFSIGGVPAGEYQATYSWESTDKTASQVGRLGGVSITGDVDMSFTLP